MAITKIPNSIKVKHGVSLSEATSDELIDVGMHLYEELFRDGRKTSGPLVLDIPPNLRGIPLELVHDSMRYVALTQGIVRYVNVEVDNKSTKDSDVNNHEQQKLARERLRIALMLASPLKGDHLPDFNFRVEVDAILALAGRQSPLEINFFRRTTRESFGERLKGDYDILQFNGAIYTGGALSNDDALVLETNVSDADYFSINNIKDCEINPTIKLIFLNAVMRSYAIAEAFIERGVSWVVALQEPLAQSLSRSFAITLYDHLAQGLSVAGALSLARASLKSEGFNPGDCFAPILFTASDNVSADSPFIVAESQIIVRTTVKTYGGNLTPSLPFVFVERKGELARISEMIDKSSALGALIHGPAGVGKTVIATEAAYRFSENFDHAIMVDAEKIETALWQIVAELKMLKVSAKLDVNCIIGKECNITKAIQEVTSVISDSGKRILLIMDTLEIDKLSGLDSNDLDGMIGFLKGLPKDKCKVLLVSRIDFKNIPSDIVSIPIADFTDNELSEYYKEIFKSAFDDRENAFDKLRKQIGGHPLTIRLINEWLTYGWSLDDILDSLEDEKGEKWKYLLSRSLKRMRENDIVVLEAISLFSSWIREDAIREICGYDEYTVVSALERLNKMMVVYKYNDLTIKTNLYKLRIPLTDDDVSGLQESESVDQYSSNRFGLTVRIGQWAMRESGNVPKTIMSLGIFVKCFVDLDCFLIAVNCLRELGKDADANALYDKCKEIANTLNDYNGEDSDTTVDMKLFSKQYNPIKEPVELARTYEELNLSYKTHKEWEEDVRYFNNALDLWEQVGHIQNIAKTLATLGNLYIYVNDWTKAGQYYERSISLSEQTKNMKIIADSIHNLGVVLHKKGDWAEAEKRYVKAIEICEESGDRRIKAQTMTSYGELLIDRGQWEEARDYYEESLRIFKALKDSKGIADILRKQGILYENRGDWGKAEEYYNNALNAFERLKDPQNMALTLNNLGNLFRGKGEWGKAEEYYNKSIAIKESLGDRHGVAQTYMNLGVVLANRGDWAKAEEYYNKSLVIKESLGDKQGMAKTFGNLGSLFYRKSDWGKAEEYYNKSLATFESLGDRHGVAQTYTNLGLLLADRGNLEKAEEYYNKSLPTIESLGDRHGMALTLGNLGVLFYRKGDWGKAEEYYNKSLATFESLGDRHGVAQTYTNLGVLLAQKGDWGKAEEYYNKSLTIKESLGDRHGVAQTYTNLGVLLAQKGDWGKAEEYYNKSLATFESLGDRHGIALTYTNIGSLFYIKGDWGKAEEYYNKSLATFESLGDRHGIAHSFWNLGVLLADRGDWGKAEEYYNKSLAIKESLGDRHGIAQTYTNLGVLFVKKNDLRKGKQFLLKAHYIFNKLGAPEAKDVEIALSKIPELVDNENDDMEFSDEELLKKSHPKQLVATPSAEPPAPLLSENLPVESHLVSQSTQNTVKDQSKKRKHASQKSPLKWWLGG